MAELKQLVFFDFEMLCSKGGMLFEDMEAIRLGAVKYELETGKVTGFDRYIRPQDQSPLSAFCRELTGIKDSDLTKADDFPEVFKEFLYWVGGIKKTRFLSWSPSDLLRLKADAARHHLPEATIEKIAKRYVDFQAIFTKRAARTAPSVEKALAFYGLEFIGEPHHPMYDAYNTFRIYHAFEEQIFKTDLIMLQQFIFKESELPAIEIINHDLKKILKSDLLEFFVELKDAVRMKDAWKLVKKTRKLAEKYENILLNRSGFFDEELTSKIKELVDFSYELQFSYEEHRSYTSKIMILHEQMLKPLQKICV